jgi:peptide/nickel transport system permease protein
MRKLWRGLAADPLARVGFVLLGLLVLFNAVLPLLPVGQPDEVGYASRFAPPTWDLPMGADNLGQPILSRVAQGMQMTFLLASLSVLISGTIAAFLSVSATYAGGLADEGSNRIADILFAFPPILLGMLVVAILQPGVMSAMIVIAAISIPPMMRVVRAETLQIMRRDFVISAEIAGVGFFSRVMTHLVPNLAEVILIQMVYAISIGMLTESALSFLGIGVQPPTASLGSMLRDGIIYLEIAPWMVLFPGLALALAIISVNLFGDGLRRMLRPGVL